MFWIKLLMWILPILASCLGGAGAKLYRRESDDPETWTGRWLPERYPSLTISRPDLHDSKHGVQMGIPSAYCDDAKTNLTIDWDYSPVNYTCYNPRNRILPNSRINPRLLCEHIPPAYVARHICMDGYIHYDRDIPTFGKHRPLWPKYGEYRFVPRQRWLHNLEHGGIVLLYHPCVNPLALDRLKSMVTNCIRKHVITPFTLLDEERPFALLAWGCRLTMSVPNYAVVKDFIMKHALRGPEMLDTEGQYDLELMVPAGKVSRMAFDELCPYD